MNRIQAIHTVMGWLNGRAGPGAAMCDEWINGDEAVRKQIETATNEAELFRALREWNESEAPHLTLKRWKRWKRGKE